MMFGRQDWLFQQEARKPTAVAETLGRFWSYFRRYGLVLVAVAVLVVVSTGLQVAVPNLMGQAVDCYLAPATQPQSNIASTSEAHCWFATLPPNATVDDYIAGLGGLVLLTSAMFVAGSLLTGFQF